MRAATSPMHYPRTANGRDPDAQAARLGILARWALVEEARLTPKPALVDARGSGAHDDMHLAMLLHSAAALEPHFSAIASAASRLPIGIALRANLRELGIAAEAAMLAATGGVNTHRGAIWSLGLMVAAQAIATREWSVTPDADVLCGIAARLARLPEVARTRTGNGALACARHGVRGARGEAEDGFPHVRAVALPVLRAARAAGLDDTQARLQALVALIAVLDDTCLLHRGGAEALAFAQTQAARVRDAGVHTPAGAQALALLDAGLLARRASPGGSADLLATTLLLDRLTNPSTNRSVETHDGNA